jgi:carotenoid cleavage dioxygenase-like enzyme
MVKHPFEGDGAVLGVTFHGDGTATSRFRYVRTNAFTMERKKGQKLYTGMEPTREASCGVGNDFPVPLFRHHLQPGLNKKRKNTSNTRVIYWAKKLLTLWEGGLPYKLDSLALSTEGRSQLGGILKQVDPFSAKGAYDSVRDRMLFYSNRQDSGSSELIIYEFNSKFRLVKENEGKREVKLPGLALLSDFAVTDNYSIFVQPPVTVNGLQFMMSKEPTKALTLEKGASVSFEIIICVSCLLINMTQFYSHRLCNEIIPMSS